MKPHRRNLVFSSVGDHSRHRLWINGPNRNFDLFLFYFGTGGADFGTDAELFLARAGTKTDNFCHLYRNHPERLAGYENVFIVDDDIVMDPAALNRMFDLFDAHELWLAQPAYTADSHIRWPVTRQDPSAVLRFTNFVEVGVMLFSRTVLDRVIGAMAQSRSGWGLDMVLSRLLGDPIDRIAILDAVPCSHPHRAEPEMDRVMSREEMRAEGRRLLDRYRRGEWLEPVTHGSIPIAGESGPDGGVAPNPGAAGEHGGEATRPGRRGPKPIQLFWWQHHHDPSIRNFGDWLSPLVVELVSGRQVEHASLDECELVAIGSLIEVVLESPRSEPVQLWGTGFIRDGPSTSDPRVRVAALRGPLTAGRFESVPDPALGDAGLLCHHLLGRRPPKRHPLGIVTHYVDLELPLIGEYRRHGRYPLLSPLMRPTDFVRAVAECEVIVSSALHGVITADALGIPNRWTVLSERVLGAGYKFRDYLGLFGVPDVSPVDLPPPERVTRDLLDSIVARYSRPGLEGIRERLASAFPEL